MRAKCELSQSEEGFAFSSERKPLRKQHERAPQDDMDRSCGWQLLESDCPEVGEPASGSGGFDGEVVEVAA